MLVPVARKLRLQYAGAIYHVMNRGDRREAIFLDDKDRHTFLETLAEAFRSPGRPGSDSDASPGVRRLQWAQGGAGATTAAGDNHEPELDR
jgi:hypothetical protein